MQPAFSLLNFSLNEKNSDLIGLFLRGVIIFPEPPRKMITNNVEKLLVDPNFFDIIIKYSNDYMTFSKE